MQDLAPCPTTFHNLWKSSGIFGTLQKLSLSLQHMHISTFGKFGRFNLDLMILYKTSRLCHFWEPAVESILAFPFHKNIMEKKKANNFSFHVCDVSWIFKIRQLKALYWHSQLLLNIPHICRPLVSWLSSLFFCRTLLKLGSLLWPENIPLLVCCSYGFIGCMRIVLQEHCGNIHVLKC